MMQKRCFKCQNVKPLGDFYRHPQMADGHLNKCKECTKRDASHRERQLKGDATWVEKQRARGREKYRRLYSTGTVRVSPEGTAEEKKRAANAVNNALRDGRLTKPNKCEDCGQPYRRIEGRHHDYTRPLEVTWLCKPCHAARHIAANVA